MKKKACVLFPGIGYTCDKPLLYYAGKIAKNKDYEVIPVPYQGFPKKVKGDRAKMEESFQIALEQSRKILSEVDWSSYEELLFVGKSVGTIVSGAYAKEKGLTPRSVYFTPLADTFLFSVPEAIALHGTSDPWASTPDIIAVCEKNDIPLELFDDANHSLETGEAFKDMEYLGRAMGIFRDFIDR